MLNSVRKLLGLKRKYPTHPPNPEPHPALQHLQIDFKPYEYLEFIEYRKKLKASEVSLEKLPVYVMARCPFCQTEYKTVFNTYTLGRGESSGSGDQFGSPLNERCAHFLAIHAFLNLNGLFPLEESRSFHNDYDVPFVSPLFLPDEVPSYAVMHSLPICRIENGQFVPRYYLYTLTYYVPENYVSWKKTIPSYPQKFRHGIISDRRIAEIKANNLHWEQFLYFPFQARQHPEWWDLPLWVRRGKLLWLDPHSPNLELKSGPVEDFPYANIQGFRRMIEIKDGKFGFYGFDQDGWNQWAKIDY